MTTTKEIQKFFHKLMALKDEGYEVTISEDNCKNYTAYCISKQEGNAKYEDCIVFYNGDPEDKHIENVCIPTEIPVEDLLVRIQEIIDRINKIFNK
jgi:hypothetical protein